MGRRDPEEARLPRGRCVVPAGAGAARDELAEAVRDAGIDPHELPAFIDRRQSTPPKLVDEHDWVRYTLGHEPPTRDELEQWLEWL
jgi:hypothetical protein